MQQHGARLGCMPGLHAWAACHAFPPAARQPPTSPCSAAAAAAQAPHTTSGLCGGSGRRHISMQMLHDTGQSATHVVHAGHAHLKTRTACRTTAGSAASASACRKSSRCPAQPGAVPWQGQAGVLCEAEERHAGSLSDPGTVPYHSSSNCRAICAGTSSAGARNRSTQEAGDRWLRRRGSGAGRLPPLPGPGPAAGCEAAAVAADSMLQGERAGWVCGVRAIQGLVAEEAWRRRRARQLAHASLAARLGPLPHLAGDELLSGPEASCWRPRLRGSGRSAG